MSKWDDYFDFKAFITPTTMKILYVLGAFVIFTTGIVSMIVGGQIGITGIGTMNAFWGGLIFIILGNLMWRLTCEWVVLFFSIHERLKKR